MALSEFEQGLRYFHEQRYDQAELMLKEALKILKRAKQEKSMGYLYILKRLAYTCLSNRKFAESEKYFTIAADMTPNVSSNPANIFAAKMNLLVLLTHTDLAKAKEAGERMMADLDEFLPVHSKDLHFMMGNIHFLMGNFDESKAMYRQVLKMSPRPVLEAQVLNNLGFCSWMHLLDLKKLQKSFEGQENADDLYKEQESRILKEESFALSYFRQSIELGEKGSGSRIDQHDLRELMDLDLEEEGADKLDADDEERYFSMLSGDNIGKALTNKAEYLLMTQAMKGETKVSEEEDASGW